MHYPVWYHSISTSSSESTVISATVFIIIHTVISCGPLYIVIVKPTITSPKDNVVNSSATEAMQQIIKGLMAINYSCIRSYGYICTTCLTAYKQS